MTWRIPLFKIYWDREDINRVTDVIKRGSYWATGPEIKDFEEKIAEYIGRRYAVTFNSGTSALHALLLAYDIKQGDEIIVPSFTFIATANAVSYTGAIPHFVDVDEKYIYFKQKSDGNRHYFLTMEGWKGCSEDFTRKVGFFRYSVIGSIEAITESKLDDKPVEIYESKNLEVSQDLALLAENRHLKRTIAQMERDQRNTSLSKLLDMLGSFVEKTKERK